MLQAGSLSTSDGGQKSMSKEMNNGSTRVMMVRKELAEQTLLCSGWLFTHTQSFGCSLDLLI